MKAAVFQGVGRGHRIENVPEPVPKPREVVVRVDTAGICGSELTLTKPQQNADDLGAAVSSIFVPGSILGHEFSGEVVALGPGAQRLKIGDRIAPMTMAGCSSCLFCLQGTPHLCDHPYANLGGFAHFALAHEDFCTVLPPQLSCAEGALIEPLSCSLNAVALSGLEPGADVLVLGAGSIGLGMIWFARQRGARRIVAVARSDKHRALALRMGADAFITQRPTLATEVADCIGERPQVVFECAGVAGMVNQAIDCARPTGTVVVAGLMLEPDTVAHAVALTKSLRILYANAYRRADFDVLASLLARADVPLAQIVSTTIGLDAFPDMFEALRAPNEQCKVLVRPWQ